MPAGASPSRSCSRPSKRPTRDQNLALSELRLPRQVLYTLWHLRDVRRLGVEDALGEGYLALVKAARAWQGEMGKRFRGYAWVSVERAILGAAFAQVSVVRVPRYLVALPHEDPLRILAEKARHITSLGVGAAHSGELWERGDESAPLHHPSLKRALRQLTPRERQVVRWVIHQGTSFRAVGRKLGVSRQRVRQILRRALTRLRQVLGQLPALPPALSEGGEASPEG